MGSISLRMRAFGVKASGTGRSSLTAYFKIHNHPDERAEYAYYLDTLGVLALRKRDLEAADLHNRRALDIRVRFLGEEHSLTAFSMANVAEGLQLEGRYDEARTPE